MPLPFQPKPLDADAAAYIARSGATDRAAINAFVRGVKALGLWNNMVCWPLRSSQNAGFGSTVYSLGGLGTFNGTLVNGPTWDSDFVDFATDNTRMTTAISVAASPVAFAFVHKAEQAQGNNSGVFLTAGVNVNGRQFSFANSAVESTSARQLLRDLWPPQTAATPVVFFTEGSRTSRSYLSARILSSSAARFSQNNVRSSADVVVTGWDASSPASVQFGFYPSFGSDSRLSFMAYFTAAVDNAADAALFSLYKSTLGTGLGLP